MAEQGNQRFKHVVPVIRSENGWEIPKFSDCVVDLLAHGEKFVEVMCCLSDDKLMITPVNDSKSLNTFDHSSSKSQKIGPLILEHSGLCPMKEVKKGEFTEVEYPKNKPYIALAVAIILESSDLRVLLTQRASTMRSYPGVWVPPGGHLDKGETLLECGLRELEEEAGLKLKPSEIKANYLCMWEAVAPPMLSLGNPVSHVVTVYIHVQVPYTWEEMQPKIKIDHTEVQAWCWFTKKNIQQLQRNENKIINTYKPGGIPGQCEETQISLIEMFRSPYLWSQKMYYSGTHQALVIWSKMTSKL